MTSAQKPIGVAYLRRSTVKQEDSLSLQLQWAIQRSQDEPFELDADEHLLQAMLNDGVSERRGLFIDNGISGSKMDRPGLSALKNRLKSTPPVGALYCFHFDRLSRFRDPLKGAELIRDILESETCIITQNRTIEPSQNRIEQLLNSMSSLVESHTNGNVSFDLAFRVIDSQIKNAELGHWNGGQPTYGFARFQIDKSTGKKVQQLKPRQQIEEPGHCVAIAPGEDDESKKKLETVKLIHDLYHTGTGLSAVAQELNRRGIPTPHAGRARKGKPVSGHWSVGTVRNILENPAYISMIAWARTSQGTHYRYSAVEKKIARQLRQDEPIEVNRDHESWNLSEPRISYEPVVPLDLWEANVEKLKERGTRSGQRGRQKTRKYSPFPIGKIICGTCGKEMVATTKQGLPAFVCGTYQRTTPKECGHNWVYRSQILWFIIETLRRTCNTSQSNVRARLKKSIEKQMTRATSLDSSPKEIERLTVERNEAERLLEKAVEQKIEHDDPTVAKAFAKKINQYGSKVTEIDRKMKQIEKAKKLASGDQEQEVEAALAVLDDWNVLAESAHADKMQRLLGLLRPEVTVDFEVVPGAKRKNQPRDAKIKFQPDSAGWDLDAQAKKMSGSDVSSGLLGSSAGEKTKLTKGNRGGQI